MSSSTTIAILFHHTREKSDISKYRISHCAEIWKQEGFEVRILRGPESRVTADILIPQVDLSVIPEDYRGMIEAQKVVVNRNVWDIRKRSFSRNLVSQNDSYNGPVIVKTDANCGGDPERRAVLKLPLQSQILPHMRKSIRVIRKIAAARSVSRLAFTERMKPATYPVYPSIREVPQAAFKNRHLVVEKFLPEQEGQHYFLRSYAFLGDHGLAVRSCSDRPVVKGVNGADLEFISVDPAIEAARQELGFDYGKFDYVVHDGKAILLDVNNTPTFGNAYPPAVRREIARCLAGGISRWVH